MKVSGNPGFTRKAWISFDLPRVSVINDATFNIIFSGGDLSVNSTFEVFGLTDESLDVWSEDTLTWNNASGNIAGGGSNGFLSGQTTFLASFTVPGNAVSGDVFSIAGSNLLDFLHTDTKSPFQNEQPGVVMCR